MNTLEQRRPLKVRGSALAQRLARWISQSAITPNQISIASVGFAIVAACALLASSSGLTLFSAGIIDRTGNGAVNTPLHAAWLLIAAICIQGRLLCNLFDGMVAVEGGKSTPAGELFNDLPDRLADPIILVAAGYAVTTSTWGPTAGWLAALLAVMTAYTRTLAVSIGAPADFRGPMAKQHRMALMTAACLLTIGEQLFWSTHYVLLVTLVIIIAGCALTVIKRSLAAYRFLEHRAGRQPQTYRKRQADV